MMRIKIKYVLIKTMIDNSLVLSCLGVLSLASGVFMLTYYYISLLRLKGIERRENAI